MKSRIIAIVFGFLLTLSISYIIHLKQREKEDAQTLKMLIETSGKNEVVHHYYRDSIKHTVFKEKIIGDTREEKSLAVGKTYIDSLQTALKISIDKMEQVSKINAELTAQLQLKERIGENGTKILSHQDKYLSLNYYPHSDSVDFAYNIKLNEVRYKERKWLLGKTHHYIDVFSDDPRVKINGLHSYKIRGQPPNRWGIGLHAGYGFQLAPNSNFKPTPIIGLGVNYNLFNF